MHTSPIIPWQRAECKVQLHESKRRYLDNLLGLLFLFLFPLLPVIVVH